MRLAVTKRAHGSTRALGAVHTSYTIVRDFSVYGELQVVEENSHSWVVAWIAARAARGLPLHLNGGGKQIRGLVHGEDIAAATVRSLVALRGALMREVPGHPVPARILIIDRAHRLPLVHSASVPRSNTSVTDTCRPTLPSTAWICAFAEVRMSSSLCRYCWPPPQLKAARGGRLDPREEIVKTLLPAVRGRARAGARSGDAMPDMLGSVGGAR